MVRYSFNYLITPSDYHNLLLNTTVTSKNPAAKSCGDARNNNLANAHDAPKKMDFPPGSAPWDMDFKGHWEMDRDLIGEFIQQQHHHKTRPKDAKPTNQVEQAMNDGGDMMLMKFLPVCEDESTQADAAKAIKLKEAQSISSLKSKFDANVKALWNDVDDPLTKPLTYKTFDDDGNASLVSSFASENNSLGLFNFNGHQPHMMEVNAPCTNLQMYSNSSSTDFMNMSDFDCNNNTAINGGRGAVYKNHHLSSSSTISPGAERFIKSGTNLQTSIWSDGEFTCEPESLIKDVSWFYSFFISLSLCSANWAQTLTLCCLYTRVKVISQHVIHVLFFSLCIWLFLGRRSQRWCHLQANKVNRCWDEKLAEVMCSRWRGRRYAVQPFWCQRFQALPTPHRIHYYPG